MKLRKAKLADAQTIYNHLLDKVKEADLVHRFSITFDQFIHLIFNKKIASIVIALQNNEIAGLIVYSKTYRDFILFDKPGIYLHDLYVAPKYRRLGIAKKLVAYLEIYAQKTNLGRIDFVVGKSNTHALNFYNSQNQINEVNHIKPMRILVNPKQYK